MLKRRLLTESVIVNEWMAEAAAGAERQAWCDALVLLLATRFRQELPKEMEVLINTQPRLYLLRDWLIHAADVSSLDDFRIYMRRNNAHFPQG